jgi:PAS domain S-box-containing protein
MDNKNPGYIGFDEFHSIVANASDGFLLVDLAGHILDANASYCKMMGYTRDELLNLHLSEIDPIGTIEDVARRSEEIIQAGSLRFESKHQHKNGVPIDVEISSNYSSQHGGSFVSFIREITSQKRTRDIIDARLRLMEYSVNHSVDELLRETLNEAEKLTGSCIGFYHFLDSDQQTLTLRAWSTQTVNKFCKAEGTGNHYHISQAGVWVDCVRENRPVIHNDYASLPHRKGTPEGHAFLVRELVVPVFRKGNIVAILGIGNKPTDYDERDVELVTILADMAFSVFEHKQFEESNRYLSEIMKNMAEGVLLIRCDNGLIAFANSKLEKMFGYESGELVGKDVSIVNAPSEQTPDEIKNSIMDILAKTGEWHGEVENIKKDGTHLWCYANVSIFDSLEHGKVFVSVHTEITERKQAEFALQKISLEMQRLLETAATGLTRCSRNLHYLTANRAYANLAGVPLEQIIGRPIVDVMGEEGLSAIMPYVERVLIGERVEYETVIPFKGSSAQYLHVVYTPDEDGHGNIIGWVASITDITERKRAENAIKESNANFSSLASNVPGYVALVEAKTLKYQYVNDEYVKSFGMPRDKIIGSHIKDVLSEANYQYALPYIKEVRSGKSASYEMTFNLVSGKRWIQVHFNPVFDDNGQVVSITVLSYDITEKKRSQEILQESEERYRKFSQLTSDFVYRCQRSSGDPFRIKWMGGAVEKITGYSQDEIFDKGCWLPLVHPEDSQRISDMLLGLVPGDTSKNEFRIITKSGEIVWLLESSLCEAGDEPGQLVLHGTSQDITDKKRAEEEHQILEKQLQQTQRLESLGVLAGGIAHDFNNILAIIMGHCSLTEMDYNKAPNHIPEIEKAVARAAELCRQMLAYAGKAQFVQAQVNIGKLVEDTVNMLNASIKKNVVIKPTIASDIPFIKADASQINQIAMNLIINGAEAIGDEQGEVWVTLSKISIKAGQSEKDYLGKIIPAGWYACLEVADTGCGMSDETYNRIFEPFYTTKFTGRGLGMSAVLGIITAQGGTLQLSSQLGKGTTFKVYLPIQIGGSNLDEPAKLLDKNETWLGSGTILLVEDEDQILQLAKTMLAELGFRVIEARNGKEALELYQKNATDINLVWTDLGMPVMDGYALFSELKKCNPALPIIISSGFGDVDITSRISRDDIAGLVGKPYNFNLLREILKNVLEGSPY